MNKKLELKKGIYIFKKKELDTISNKDEDEDGGRKWWWQDYVSGDSGLGKMKINEGGGE